LRTVVSVSSGNFKKLIQGIELEVELEIELIQIQITLKSVLREAVNARALRASQNVKRAGNP
jgi:hypothetical protein